MNLAEKDSGAALRMLGVVSFSSGLQEGSSKGYRD